MEVDMLLWVVLSIIIGTLAAIVYSLRVLVLMERRVARIEEHIENLVETVVSKEDHIERMIGGKKSKKR